MDTEQTQRCLPGPYGVPADKFSKAWSLQDIIEYTGMGRTSAYRLMREPDAPPRLRLGSPYRWNGLQVLAWLHGDDWRTMAWDAGNPPTHVSNPVGPARKRPALGWSGATSMPSSARPGTAERSGGGEGKPDVSGPVSHRVPPGTGQDSGGPDLIVVDPAAMHAKQRSQRLGTVVRGTGGAHGT